MFYQNEVKVPIWYKKDAYPKYICYCSKITENEIIDAITNENAETIKDIIKITGAMENCNCKINHPTGNCCSPYIQDIINKYK